MAFNVNWEVILWTCITIAVLLGVGASILTFISARNLRRRRDELGKVHTELKIGSKVVFGGGIYGRIVAIEEETVNVEVAKSTVMTISRYAIQSLVEDKPKEEK